MSNSSPDSDSKGLSRDASLDKMKLDGTASHVEQSSLAQAPDFDDSIEDTEPSRAVWLITFTVAMGGFLFGVFNLPTSIPILETHGTHGTHGMLTSYFHSQDTTLV